MEESKITVLFFVGTNDTKVEVLSKTNWEEEIGFLLVSSSCGGMPALFFLTVPIMVSFKRSSRSLEDAGPTGG
jgi:hypothetical protein